nr:MAG TPA: hypothetical protein [Caudoviricetes sp.]
MTRTEVRSEVRDFNELPLLTPEEAFERAWEEGGSAHPVFDLGYRVRDLNSWKEIETLLCQNDVPDITVASFGLNRFEEIFGVFDMMSKRGWHLWPTEVNVYVDWERKIVQAIRAHYSGD